MKHICTAGIALFLMTVLAACGVPPAGDPQSDESPSQLAQSCARTPSFAHATPAGVFTTPAQQTGIARSYEEIYDAVSKVAVVYNSPQYDSSRREIDRILAEELKGKLVSGWEGWVVSTGIEAKNSLQVGWGRDYDDEDVLQNPSPYHDAILVSMDDPYAGTPTPVPQRTFEERGSYIMERPYIALLGVKQFPIQLCIGQRVRFDGYLMETPTIIYQRGDYIVAPTRLEVVANETPGRVPTHDLNEVFVKMARWPGWSGPRYQVLAFGDGTVVYENRVPLSPYFRIGSVPHESIRQLLGEFDKAGFDAMPGTYEMSSTDGPSAQTVLFAKGNIKSVFHFQASVLPDEEITNLEKAIDRLLEASKWLPIEESLEYR